MGDAGDAHRGFGRAVAGEITGELGVRAFHDVRIGIEAEITFDHDLRGCRHVEVHGLAFHQLDRGAADRAHHVVFAHTFCYRSAGAEAERRLPADRHRDRHLRLAAVLPRGVVMADMLRAPHQNGNAIMARNHPAVDPDIHHAGFGILGNAAAVSEEITATVKPIPMR